jgi:23S rRNA (pseudouridine1915-N3)-methyltransferase
VPTKSLCFISVGKDRSGLFQPGVDEYTKRLSHHSKIELIELPESSLTGAKAKADEAARIAKRIPPGAVLVVLDERGKPFSSVELAQWFQTHRDEGRHVAFVIGGDEGLDESLRQKAQLVLSLSKMTLPHRLARLVLLEQVYRAGTIIKKEPYHK